MDLLATHPERLSPAHNLARKSEAWAGCALVLWL